MYNVALLRLAGKPRLCEGEQLFIVVRAVERDALIYFASPTAKALACSSASVSRFPLLALSALASR
jgi:hypothetical protein